MYVNGVQTGTRAQTGALRASTQPLRFGGNAVWPEWFARPPRRDPLYDRALSAAQIQADMAKAVSSPTLLRSTAKAGAKKPAARAKRSAGAKVKRYRGHFTHHGKWLGRTYSRTSVRRALLFAVIAGRRVRVAGAGGDAVAGRVQ